MRLCARRRITWIGLGAMLAMLIALPTLHPYGGAQAQPTFSTGSLMGTYASVAQAREGRSPAASLRLLTFDGNGGFTGTSHTNGLGPFFDERQDVDVSIDGTYSLDPEGTGTGTLTATFPDGTVTTATFHLLVTRASATTNGLAASEVTFVWDNLGPRSGGLVTDVLTQLPVSDTTGFSTGSLMGTYASVAQAREGRSPAASLRLLTFDGNGGFTGTSHTNGLGPFFDERQDVDVNIDGTYSLDPEGTGTGTLTATFPDGTVTTATFHLLVTRASATTNGLAASEVTLVWDNLGPRSGGLVTEVWSRQVE